jgi:uncharacterized protein YceH (UPF0502 family)
MATFTDGAEVEQALEALAVRSEGAVVQRLARQPGRREARYAQLLTGAPAEELTAAIESPEPAAPRQGTDNDARFARVNEEIRQLRGAAAGLQHQ